MATNYSPAIVTDGAVFVGDALMPSTATSATKLYNRAGSSDGIMYNGACCDFDGTDDDIHTTNDITISKACAVSVWISSDTSTQHILSNKSGGPVNLRFGMDSGKMTYQYYSGAWRYLYSTSTIPLTTWTHLTWVRTADNFISFYINGVLDAGPTQALGSDGSASSSTVNGPVNIVGGYWSSAVFNGRMADFKVFNTALSSTQVKQMYDDSKVIIPAGIEFSDLDLWYPMSEGVGTIAYDGSGLAGSANNPGIGQNFNNDEFLSGQNGCPQLLTGYNRPLKFASGDYVNVPVVGGSTGPLAIGTNDFTVCGWWFGDPSQTQGPNLFMQFSGAGGWRLVATSSPAYRFTIFDNGWSNYAYKDVSVTLGTWQHIAVSCDRDGTAVCYLNGSASGSALDISSVTGSLTNSDPFRIGNGNYTNATPSSDWTFGVVNECMFFNGIALNATDIAALAATDAAGTPLPPDPKTMSFNTSGYSTSHLKGYWRNASNKTWTDASGNSNTGTVYGGPKDALLFKEGYNGSKNVHTGRDNQGFPLLYQNNGAIGFDGVKDYVNITPALEWSVFPSVTVSLWMQTDFTGAINYAFFSWGNSSNSGGLNMVVNSSGYFYVTYRDDAWSSGNYPTLTSTTSKVNDKKWHQCVFTYGGDPTIYLDGVVNGTASRNSAMTNISSELTYIGHLANHAVGNYHFDGRVANLQVYNRALSYAEIKQNYNAQKNRFI